MDAAQEHITFLSRGGQVSAGNGPEQCLAGRFC